jgi:pimeloyl-ACP methyl ester carboxylesterase
MTPELTTLLLTARTDGSAPDPTLPVLVVGPSLGTSVQSLWGPAITALAPHFTVIGWDLPGHGEGAPLPEDSEGFSIEELAQAVVNTLETQKSRHGVPTDVPTYYAGVSIAGAVALQIGLDHGSEFAGLASICSAAKIGTPEGWKERGELVAKAGTPTQVIGSAQRWFGPGFIEKNAFVSTDLLHNLQEADRFSYAFACGALAGFDVRDRLGEITTPVLALNGAEDQVCSAEDAEFTASHVAHGSVVMLPGVGHLAPAEDPAATAAALVDFFLSATTTKEA